MLRVCVIFGGASSEHEVSLRSATCVLENIDRSRYEVVMLGISKKGRWYYYDGPIELIQDGKWEYSSYARPAILSPDPADSGIILLGENNSPSKKLRTSLISGSDLEFKANAEGVQVIPVDVMFPVLHGKNGEDGTIQGLFELAQIPYVGCGVLSSAVCMDKEVSHIVMVNGGINKTELVAVYRDDMSDYSLIKENLEEKIGYPMFVKPANSGSSVGVSKVKDAAGLRKALNDAFLHDSKAVVEKSVTGREIECAVWGNHNPEASYALGEIIPEREFYDYNGKYLDDTTELHAPAEVEEKIAGEIRETAIKAYKLLGCKGLARVDFFVEDDGRVVLNEINTMPGFTSISMYPRLFQIDGVSTTQLIDNLIGSAMEK